MLQLTLGDDEVLELREILASYLSDLRMEIVDTDSGSFRARLKARETFIGRLLSELGAPDAGSSR